MTFVFLLLTAADFPAVIDYEAPAECASEDAFKAEVQSQLSQAPQQARRFSVRIHQGNDFSGTLTTTSGTREIHAQSCAEVTSALAVIMAMAMPVAAPSASTPSAPPAAEVVEVRPSTPGTVWRLGARLQGFNQLLGPQEVYQSPSQIFGGAMVGSVEPQWGRYRMLFELAVGLAFAGFPSQPRISGCNENSCDAPSVAASHATFLSLDAQVCPLDVALGRFGLATLLCARLGVAQQWVTEDLPYSTSATNGLTTGGLTSTTNVTVRAGANVRLRWQSPWYIYAEAQVGVVAASQSAPLSGSPLTLDWGATLGTRL